MSRKIWIGAGLMACTVVAFAGTSRDAVRQQAEASVLVTGTVDIDANGSVTNHAIDHPDKLKGGITDLVDGSVSTWRFEPVLEDGKAHGTTAKMRLLIVANRLDGDQFSVRIRSAHFTEAHEVPGSSLSAQKLGPPKYPAEALRAGVSGTTYAVVRVDRQGKVVDVDVEQVNLRVVGTEPQMHQLRDVLARATKKAARDWRFTPPTVGKHATDQFWSARVPVAYRVSKSMDPRYGQWEPYIPGPKKTIPWLDSAGDDLAASPEAMAPGGVYQIGQGLHLLTPLGDG